VPPVGGRAESPKAMDALIVVLRNGWRCSQIAIRQLHVAHPTLRLSLRSLTREPTWARSFAEEPRSGRARPAPAEPAPTASWEGAARPRAAAPSPAPPHLVIDAETDATIAWWADGMARRRGRGCRVACGARTSC
jgi:hypothetical protein